jgi:amino acid transporter
MATVARARSEGAAPAPAPPSAPPPAPSRRTAHSVKRLFLGRPLATARLEHERLSKSVALAVFSSDNMSSVAYATEEILRVLIPAVGIAAFSYLLPISGLIVLVEAILVFSYRQTIKAYPSAGGAYIVTKDNLGLLPAQLAGVALLVDYVLTVAVSVAAGVQAISSVTPLAVVPRVVISLAFVWIIAYGNLLGVRESGRIFAAPTYLFIGSLFLTCGFGLYQVLTHHVAAFSVPAQVHAGGLSPGLGAVGVLILFRAFASGGAAVTGVEAISNGVPAFRKPEWRNAQITLGWMASILGASFLAVSFLAYRLHVLPVADESKSVLAQIAQAVYGSGAGGHALFLVLQVSTTLILVLAANTSFADFPRLASFHAGDSFMPRQLTKRGHRLVFSNGILALAGAATIVILLFKASVSAMIPLYALGVFTSFTLSQAGMAKRHLRLREKGWRFGLFVNGLGAVATLIVMSIIGVVKFTKGAWMVVLFVPILVFVLVHVNRTYEEEDADLSEGLDTIARPLPHRTIAVVLVNALDEKTYHALQYAMTIGPSAIVALHLATGDLDATDLPARWMSAGIPFPLQVLPCKHGRGSSALAALVGRLRGPDTQITVIVPGPARLSFWQRVRRGRSWSGLVKPLRPFDDVLVVVIRDHGGTGHREEMGRLRLSPRVRHVAVILVDQLDWSVLRAIRYARSIDALDIRAVHAGVDPARARVLAERWAEVGPSLEVPLDIDACFDRDIAGTIARYVNELRREDAEITVIIPRREYPRALQRLLHDRTSRSIARALAGEGHVDVVMVPYRLSHSKHHPKPHPSHPAPPSDEREPAPVAR